MNASLQKKREKVYIHSVVQEHTSRTKFLEPCSQLICLSVFTLSLSLSIQQQEMSDWQTRYQVEIKMFACKQSWFQRSVLDTESRRFKNRVCVAVLKKKKKIKQVLHLQKRLLNKFYVCKKKIT